MGFVGCPSCGGTGKTAIALYVPQTECGTCHGSGQVHTSFYSTGTRIVPPVEIVQYPERKNGTP